VCFITSECFKATTSGFSHQQLVSEPRSSENRSVLGDIRIFKVVKNKFWSFQSVEFIHTNSLAQKSAWSETEVANTRHLKILHCLTTRARGWRRVLHTRAIFAPSRASKPIPPSRAVRRAESKPRRADRIFYRIFPVQPSEPPDAQNWFCDRFTLFLTQFQQSQTGSRLFRPFRIDLRCPFFQIQLPERDIVIKRAKWLQKVHKHSSQSWPKTTMIVGASD